MLADVSCHKFVFSMSSCSSSDAASSLASLAERVSLEDEDLPPTQPIQDSADLPDSKELDMECDSQVGGGNLCCLRLLLLIRLPRTALRISKRRSVIAFRLPIRPLERAFVGSKDTEFLGSAIYCL